MVTRIVLLVGNGVGGSTQASLSGENSILAARLAAAPDARVDLIAYRLPRDISGVVDRHDVAMAPIDRLADRLGGRALFRHLGGFPLGVLLNSLSLLDPRRVFWRAVRRDRGARALLRHADVVIATDLAGTTAAWHAVRRRWVGEALYDHGSAGITDVEAIR